MAQAPRTRRQQLKDQPEARAERARTLLDNAEVREVFKQAETELFDEFQRIALDGSDTANRRVLALKAEMDALNRVKRIILRPIVVEAVKQAGVRKRNL